jgi:hypothetical protein
VRKPQNITRLASWLVGGMSIGTIATVISVAACSWRLCDARQLFESAKVACVIAGIAGAVAGGIMSWRPMNRRQRILGIVALFFYLPMFGMFGKVLVYEPLKFGYLIRRVEAAKTSAEERAALELVNRWGNIWEIHLESPPGKWLDSRELHAVVDEKARPLVVEIEWFETRLNGTPYRAVRTLNDKSNIYVLLSRSNRQVGAGE